jgi:protocatechuate 3,4-dioxygenase beta subunit
MKSKLTVRVFAALAFMVIQPARFARADGPPPTPPPPANVSSVGTIADASEPGARLIFTGQVFAPDGVTPASGVFVYAYQTDATGQYHNDPNTRVARLHGWAKTDAQGHFEFRTIHPGAYPGRQIAAHIHFHVWGGGYPLQWTPELLFTGDPFLKPEEISESGAAGKFGSVRALTTGADGVQHCTFNIRVSNVTNYPPGTQSKH